MDALATETPEDRTARPADLQALLTPAPRRRWRWAALGLLLAALAAGGTWLLWTADAAPPSYPTARVERVTLEDLVSAMGNLQPRDFVDVGTQITGRLEAIHVTVGERVRAGQLLAELDPVVFQARVDGGRAQRANLEAQLRERDARLALARQQRERQRNLKRANATSAEAVEQAEAEVQVIEAQIAALEAQVRQVSSQLRADEANLGYTRIFAPMAGTVVSISARRGQTLNANQSAPIILRIADLAVMTVVTQVSEADVGRLAVGQEAWFTTLGRPDRRFAGRLQQIMPTPEVTNNVVLYQAMFEVPNPEGSLMTQMTAQVFFVVARAEDVLAVPVAALRDPGPGRAGGGAGDPLRRAVLVQGPDGTVERRLVQTGVATRTLVEIKEGLAAGETVVIGPATEATGGNGAPRRSALLRARLG